jgi:hypothetical protein
MTLQSSTISIAKTFITLGFLPRPVMLRKLNATEAFIKRSVNSNYISKPSNSIKHTCQGMEWHGDGPSPSEFCNGCQYDISEYHKKEISPPLIQVSTCEGMEWHSDSSNHFEMYDITEYYDKCRQEISILKSNTSDNIIEEMARIREFYRNNTFLERYLIKYDLDSLVDFDIANNIHRPWWFYQELDLKYVKKPVDDIHISLNKKVCRSIKSNAREYIINIDSRPGKIREVEFDRWLAIPKNKRPIFLEGGRMGSSIAKGNIGSIIIKNCPINVLLCDIRIILAQFGGIRDVYRPRDRTTGKPKPFVFVEIVDAWSVVDHYSINPFILDDNTFMVEGAGERKTTDQMAAIQPTTAPTETIVPVVETKKSTKVYPSVPKIAGHKGAFAALMYSDSDSE